MTRTSRTARRFDPRWRKLSIRIKLLIPVIVATIVAAIILGVRVPPPINALVERNARSDFTTRLTELRTPIAEFLRTGQKDLLELANSSDLEAFLIAQANDDKSDFVAAQSGIASLFVGKITQGQMPYSEIRYLKDDGKQLARATARKIGGAISGVVVPTSTLVSENLSGYSDDIGKLSPDSTYVLPVHMSMPSKDSRLTPEPLIEIVVPVRYQSKLVGFIVGGLRTHDFLVQTFQQIGKSVSYQSVLADQRGQILALTDPSVPDGVSILGDETVARLSGKLPIAELDGTLQNLQTIQDRVYISLALNRLDDLPQSKLLLIVGDDLETIYAGARELEITLFITLSIVFIIAIGGIGFVSQSAIQPLLEVSHVADRVSAGDLEAKAPIKSEDEVGMVALALNTMSSRLSELIRTLELRVRERTRNIEIAAEISRDTTQLTSLNDLLQRTVNVIRDRFELYHVQIFLADAPNEYAELVVGTGEPAAQMLAEKHKLKKGSASIVGQAMERECPVMTLDTQQRDISHRFNPYLPLTRSEMAVPLRISNTTIGVLDIQSTQLNAFDSEDENTFQMIANQLAIAVDNARLFEHSQEARRMADEANRQKSEFLSNMSHELRTPLNVIIGYSHSMLTRPAMYDDVPLPPVYASAIESIQSSGQHLFGLINDILDLSKIEAGRIDLDIKPIDVLPVLEGVRSTALGLIKKGVQLRVDYPSKLPLVMGDELRIRQILLNLLSNAAKFTSQGFVTINAVPQDGKVVFSVADTGRGITDEVRPFIFERFQQGSSSITKKFGGSGLGLNISKQLAQLHGGEIWFESEVGKGSIFYFAIPLVTMEEKVSQPDSVTVVPMNEAIGTSHAQIFVTNEESPANLLRQVLVVDADSETRAYLETALGNAGYSVLSTDNYDRAVNIAMILEPEAIVIHLHDSDTDQMKALSTTLRAGGTLASSTIIVVDAAQASNKPEDLCNLVLERLQTQKEV